VSGVLIIVVDILGVTWNDETELAVKLGCFRGALGPSIRSVDDGFVCFLLTKDGSFQLGPKTFITGGLVSPEVEPRDGGTVGPFLEAHADLCCVLLFRSTTISLSGSVQETSNMVLDTQDQHQDYRKSKWSCSLTKNGQEHLGDIPHGDHTNVHTEVFVWLDIISTGMRFEEKCAAVRPENFSPTCPARRHGNTRSPAILYFGT
jgi:hypothetical protein